MPLWVVLTTAIAVFLLTLFLQFKWKNMRIIEAAKTLPCPPTSLVVGNMPLFTGGPSTLHQVLINITNQFKELFCIWIGPVPVFVVSKPEDIQIVLNSSNTIEKDDVYQFLKGSMGNGIFISPAPTWKKYRRLISPSLHPNTVDNYLTVFNNVSRQLTNKLLQFPKTDPRYDIFSLTVDASVNTVVDSENSVDEKSKRMLHNLFDELGTMFINRVFKVWLHVEWIYKLMYWNKLYNAMKTTEACRQRIVELTKESLVRRLTNKRSMNLNGEPEKNLVYLSFVTPEDVTEDHTWWDEIATMIVGATDTMVSSLSFFLLSIAIDHEVQSKIRKEIQEVMGDSMRDVTVKDIDSLTYLGQAFMESIRLHGVLPVIMRKATKDIKLTTSTLPVGSRIVLPLHAMGWDTDTFPEPHKFQPDRFSPENISTRHKYAFIPFSGGPRGCAGKKYAMNQMKILFVHILRMFKVKTNMNMEDIDYEIKVIMYSKTPVTLEFVPL